MFRWENAKSIPAGLFDSAKAHPYQVAFVDPPSLGNTRTTYQDMFDKSVCVAARLKEFGVETADRIGLLSTGRSWWPICDLAIMSIGALTVPIYPSLPPSQIAFIVNQSGMVGIFVEDVAQYEKLFEAHKAEPLGLKFIVLLADVEIDKNILVDAPWPIFRYGDWSVAHHGKIADIIDGLCLLEPSNPATIVYTSGTTGEPKGVILTHGNILANLDGIFERLVLRADDIHLSYLPLSHILERTCGMFMPLFCGSTICYVESVEAIAEEFERIRPTTFTTVPRLLEKVAERIEATIHQMGGWREQMFRRALAEAEEKLFASDNPPRNLKDTFYNQLVFKKIKQALGGRLRMVVSGGAPLAPHVCRFFWCIGIPVCEGYGMTETSPVVAFNAPNEKRLGTVGRKVFNVDIQLAEDGELLVKGPSVFDGYYRNIAADEAAFNADGWLRTGDIATISPDGYVQITDRKKNLIVLSTGKKVTPAPIENDMLQSSYIDQVCLIGQGRKFVAAVIVPNKEALKKWISKEQALGATADVGDAVTQLLLEEAIRTTSRYARFEQPKQVIVAEPFTIENGLLTPTLKVKTASVCAVYAAEIESLYETGSSIAHLS